MKLAVIGLGNMAIAIVNGLLQTNTLKSNEIIASANNLEKLKVNANKLGIEYATNNIECIENADYILLAVKPEMLEDVCSQISPFINNKVIISIAAKKTISDLQKYLNSECKIIRVMPNLNVSIGQGISSISSFNVTSKELEEVNRIFSSIGAVVHIEESQISGFIGLAGSMSAFIFRFIHVVANEVMSEGYTYDEAIRIACIAISGSANYLLNSTDDATTLIRKVASPNGTTEQGLKKMDELNFDEIVSKVIRATINRDKGI